MSDKTNTTNQAAPPIVITLTLTESDSLEHTGTLLIQRGDLAHLRQFVSFGVTDIAEAIQDAYSALTSLEANPPVLPELPNETPKPAAKGKAKSAQQPATAEEPTIDIPLKKGTQAIKLSYLKIVGGETDAAAYRQAVLIAGKLIDGKLWDGQSPIRIDDVYTTMKKMKHLSDKELSLFTLEDFVRVDEGEIQDSSALITDTIDQNIGDLHDIPNG